MKQKFLRKVLSNGMTVILEKRDFPIVSVSLALRYGGMHEAREEKGIAHFIEHMLYKGTPTRNAKQIAEEIERNGGHLNGFTDETITAYFCKLPSEHLGVALEVLSDMVTHPKFDATELEKERNVIFEEMKMRRDEPKTYVHDRLQGFLYEAPFGIDLIGTPQTMKAIDRAKIVEVFRRVYTPEHMVLCVVGDADFETLVTYCEKHFVTKKGSVRLPRIQKKNEKKVEKRKGLDQANMMFAFHIPEFGKNHAYAAKVLSVLMGGGLSSRLFSEIREKRNLAYSIHSGTSIHKEYAYLYVYCGTKKENVEKVKTLILEEFNKVSKELGQEELEEVKKQILGNYHIAMEDSLSQMMHLLEFEMNGDAHSFYQFENAITKVQLEEVKKMAKIQDYSFFALVPE